MDDIADDYNICECCGTEFGYHDAGRTHEELRKIWINDGKKWWFRDAPKGWNADEQLVKAGFNE